MIGNVVLDPVDLQLHELCSGGRARLAKSSHIGLLAGRKAAALRGSGQASRRTSKKRNGMPAAAGARFLFSSLRTEDYLSRPHPPRCAGRRTGGIRTTKKRQRTLPRECAPIPCLA